MKTIQILIVTFLTTSAAYSQSSITFSLGLGVPNNQINDVYNNVKLSDDANRLWNTLRDATKEGYNMSARLRFPLSENFQFDGGVGFARFPLSQIAVKDPVTDSTVLTLATTQNVIPLSAGLDFLLVHSAISPYVCAELQYNYISSTVDYPANIGSIPLNLDTAPVDSRVGAAFGGGVMINLAVAAINVDMRYHFANLIGKTENEKNKCYLTLNAGVTFGWK